MLLRLLPFVALIAASSLAAQQSSDPAQLFGVRERIEQIDISPDGSRVVFLQAGPGRETFVFVHNLGSDGEPQLVIRSNGDPERFRRCNFATNDRLVCQIWAMTGEGINLIPFSRLVSVDINGQNRKMLGERSSQNDARLRQYDGDVLDWTGGESGSILMVREHVPEIGRIGSRLARSGDGLGVDRVDVRTLRSTRVEPPNPRANGYISDGRGNVRIMSSQEVRGSTGMAGTDVNYYYRTADSRDWRPFGTYDTLTGAGLYPVAVDPTLNAAYALQKLNGRYALYRIKLDGSMTTELVHSNDQVDVDGVVWGSRGVRVIGVTFADERRRNVYFDPAYEALARSLGRAIPNLPLIDFGSSSEDGNRVVVHAGADNDAGRYYVYDRSTRSLNEILMVRPELENVPLAQVRSVNYPAPDGAMVPAYLTLPPGREARNLPVVILPHGGPAARDEWGFDWLPNISRIRAMPCCRPITAARPAMATNGCDRMAFAAGAPRSPTSAPVRAGWRPRGSAIPTGWRSSAGPMAAMPRSRPESPSPACSRRSSRSRPSPTCSKSRTIFATSRSAGTSPNMSAAARIFAKARRCRTSPRLRRRCCSSTATAT